MALDFANQVGAKTHPNPITVQFIQAPRCGRNDSGTWSLSWDRYVRCLEKRAVDFKMPCPVTVTLNYQRRVFSESFFGGIRGILVVQVWDALKANCKT